MIINALLAGHIDLLSVVVVQPITGDVLDKQKSYYNVLLLGGHTVKVYNFYSPRDLFISDWIKAKALQHSIIN